MARYTIFKKPRFCPNATHYGGSKYAASVGDLILYRERYEGGTEGSRLARVLGLANELPDRSDPGKDTLVVLAASDMMNYAYERFVKLEDVLEIREPSQSAFARWFLSGPMPHPDVAIAAVKYGCVNNSYLDDHLEDGELKASFRTTKIRKGAA